MLIRLGHSPDPDDAFMFWALAEDKIDTRGFEFELIAEDIGTLNEWALEGRLDVTALSLGAYPLVQDTYALLPNGASIGTGYGPVVVARERLALDDLRAGEVVVPGRTTTAFLVLRLALGDFASRELPFDQIIDEVTSGRARAGLVIHEGQLTYAAAGLQKVVDLGEWWLLETGLPLPLGVNAVRRDVERLPELAEVLGRSIRAGLDERREALAFAMQFGRGIDDRTTDKFVEMYVNHFTCDYGDEGREAVREVFRRAEAIGHYDRPVHVDFVA